MAVAAPEAVASAAPRIDLAAVLKSAVMTALLSFLLFLPLIGFKTEQNMNNELVLEMRWPLLLTFVAIIAAAHLFGSLVIAPWRARRALKHARSETAERLRVLFARRFAPFAIGCVLVYPVIVLAMTGVGGAVK